MFLVVADVFLGHLGVRMSIQILVKQVCSWMVVDRFELLFVCWDSMHIVQGIPCIQDRVFIRVNLALFGVFKIIIISWLNIINRVDLTVSEVMLLFVL